jgi:hypothetical protein
VSVEEKAPWRCQIRFRKMSESEPLMTYRETVNDVKTTFCSLTWDKCGGDLNYRLRGIRYLSGMSLNQAATWNVGNSTGVLRETLKRAEPASAKVPKSSAVADWFIVAKRAAKAARAKEPGLFCQRHGSTRKRGRSRD